MSCLFNSVFSLLNDTFNKAGINNLRYFLIFYIKNHLDEKIDETMTIKEWCSLASIEKFGEDDIDKYLTIMNNDSTWGGGFEIAIISHVFRLKIHIIEKDKKIVTFNNCIDKKPFYDLYLDYNGSHYEPLKIEKINI
jgi:hypothetical protein